MYEPPSLTDHGSIFLNTFFLFQIFTISKVLKQHVIYYPPPLLGHPLLLAGDILHPLILFPCFLNADIVKVFLNL